MLLFNYLATRRKQAEKLYIREYTSGYLRKTWSQAYCLQTALIVSFACFSQLTNRRQYCVCFDLQSQLLNLADHNQTYILNYCKLSANGAQDILCFLSRAEMYKTCNFPAWEMLPARGPRQRRGDAFLQRAAF